MYYQINFSHIVSFRGRNGDGKQMGIEAYQNINRQLVELCPVTSKGHVSDAAKIEIPFENLPALIKSLQEIADRYPTPGQTD